MSTKIITFLEKETKRDFYKSHKYCFESIEVNSIPYDDRERYIVKDKGETNPPHKFTHISLLNNTLSTPPLFKFFLDGSRRTYKVDDIVVEDKIYPIIAGQIGVACCERHSPSNFKGKFLEKHLVMSIIDDANPYEIEADLFYNGLCKKINENPFLKSRNITFSKILPYRNFDINETYSEQNKASRNKYESKGIARIQDEMIEYEKKLVEKLCAENLLNDESYLIKDGSLQYSERSKRNLNFNERAKFSLWRNNYRNVVGVSKAFDPELFKDKRNKSMSKFIASLKYGQRTPAQKYKHEDNEFSIWYVRLRHTSDSPFSGVVKVEKLLVTDDERDYGLDTEEVNNISINLIQERNPVAFGRDGRWANHLYPVYLTEQYIKNHYMSDLQFLNLF